MSSFHIREDPSGVGDGEDVVVLVVGGEVDYTAGPQLEERVAGHIDAGVRRMMLDLTTATFIDSTVIGVLVGAAARLRKLGGGAVVAVCGGADERIPQIFEVAGVESIIPLYHSRLEAMSALLARR